MALVKIPVVSCAEIITPYKEYDKFSYVAVVDVYDLPKDLDNWRKVNPRQPKINSQISKKVKESLITEPERFLFRNRGLTIIASKVYVSDSEIIVEFVDEKIHGLLDGGHTFSIIQNIIKDSNQSLDINDQELKAMVRVEIMTGFREVAEVVEIVESRNTSTQVKEQSIHDLLGEFDSIKDVLADKHYGERIFYKEYEVDNSTGRKKDIDIRKILSYLVCMDKEIFGSHKHPIFTYSSKGNVETHFIEHSKRLQNYIPLLPNILYLKDLIQYELPEQHNSMGGRFGALAGVKDKAAILPFMSTTSGYDFPESYVYPILSAFRVLLDTEEDNITWKYDPFEIWDDTKAELTKIVTELAKAFQDPQQLGKKKDAWEACYNYLANFIGETDEDYNMIDYPKPKRENFHFDMVNIPIESILHFKSDPSITCTVTYDNKVIFEGQTTSLSDAALTVLHRQGITWQGAQGPAHWTYNGVLLTDLREEKENKNKLF
jgi:hypothetical protein